MIELQARAQELISMEGSVRAAAQVLGIDAGYLHRLATGDKSSPGDQVLEKLGLRRVVTFERIGAVVDACEPLVRYCPGCGHVGPVDTSKYHDCCPDGNEARMIPLALAEKCRDTFKVAVESLIAQKAAQGDALDALAFLAGLHPCLTVDGPPMEVAQRIFDAVLAEQRALRQEIADQERALEGLRQALAAARAQAKEQP